MEIANTALSVLLFLLSFGFASAVLKNYALDFEGQPEQQRRMIGSAFGFVMPVVVVCAVTLSLAAPWIAQVLFGDAARADLVVIVLATTVCAIFVNLGFAVLRAQEAARRYTILFLTRFAALLALNIGAVVVLHAGVRGILIGNLVTYALACAMLAPTLVRSAAFVVDAAQVRRLLAFGLPLVPASMAQWFMDLSDRYFLRASHSLAEVGVYSLGYKIGFVVLVLLVTPFQLAWPTISFRSAATHEDPRRLHARALTYLVLVGCGLTLVLSLFARDVIVLFSRPEFVRGASVVWIVATSYVLYGAHFVVAQGIHVAKKTRWYPWILVGAAVINVLCNVVLIPSYGMIGAAFATLIAFGVMFGVTLAVSVRVYPVKYEWTRLAVLIGVTGAVLLLAQLVPAQTRGVWIFVKCTLIVGAGVVVWISPFFESGERALIRGLWARIPFFKKKSA